jgi:hypothetical protein
MHAFVSPVQTIPQPPQLPGSNPIFTHLPPQFFWPAGQPEHTPFRQTVVPEQTLPQAPQLFRSLLGSTQTPLHQVFVGQTQVPPEHTGADGGQTIPQAPQLYGSAVRLVQTPPQQ